MYSGDKGILVRVDANGNVQFVEMIEGYDKDAKTYTSGLTLDYTGGLSYKDQNGDIKQKSGVSVSNLMPYVKTMLDS